MPVQSVEEDIDNDNGSARDHLIPESWYILGGLHEERNAWMIVRNAGDFKTVPLLFPSIDILIRQITTLNYRPWKVVYAHFKGARTRWELEQHGKRSPSTCPGASASVLYFLASRPLVIVLHPHHAPNLVYLHVAAGHHSVWHRTPDQAQRGSSGEGVENEDCEEGHAVDGCQWEPDRSVHWYAHFLQQLPLSSASLEISSDAICEKNCMWEYIGSKLQRQRSLILR